MSLGSHDHFKVNFNLLYMKISVRAIAVMIIKIFPVFALLMNVLSSKSSCLHRYVYIYKDRFDSEFVDHSAFSCTLPQMFLLSK